MRQLAGSLGFTIEPPPVFVFFRRRGSGDADRLQRHQAVDAWVTRLIHSSHGAATQFGNDFVASQLLHKLPCPLR